MPKESESLKDDANKSEIVNISPDDSEEEVLSSEQVDAQTYESRLNDKLRELDLYEDDMTIQQKEELLQVVFASWESAEKEKNRRQFYQEYEAASEAFISDQQIEFNFNRSSIPLSQIPLPGEAPCCSSDFSASLTAFHISSESPHKSVFSSKSSELQILSSSAPSCTSTSDRESYPKARTRRSLRLRFPPTILEENEDSQASDTSTSHLQLPSLEDSLSLWKPCLSPKDEPLACKKRPWMNEKPSTKTLTQAELSFKESQLQADFDLVSRTVHVQDRWTYSRPYHLTHRKLFSKRPGKPDEHDVMIGVPEDSGDASQEAASTEMYTDPLQLCESSESACSIDDPLVDTCCSEPVDQRSEQPCVVVEETLPRFNHVAGPSGEGQRGDLVVNGAVNHVNSSCAESNSSECSSVIDVETIVDEEIEEFVLKRKLIQTYPEQDSTPCQSKKLKKSAS